ncbi:hypothetical protein DYB34_003700 [Aphanomyces astaci]|uniref:Ubiquitin-like protease family profile domain-containing protein n=1 Tax=Aphanomyces astaci TaxID=112090 RepID=A0A418BFE7_APHAT|nr:hypothetical protein DYB34_003700 [Aphanomyces astaci]
MKRLRLVSDKPLWVATQPPVMSRREFWNQLHSALPSEYKSERSRIRTNKHAETPNDPFGVQTVKSCNADLATQLAQTMNHLSQRKKGPWTKRGNASGKAGSVKQGDKSVGGRAYYRHIDLESYHSKWHEKASQIHDIETQLQTYRVTRESGDIERQHDAWVANRQWELGDIIDELLEESDAGKELPDDDDQVVEDALHGGPMHEVLCQKFNVDVSRTLLQCLLPATWLNDEVRHAHDRHLKSHYFNSFFFAKVSEGGYNYVNVRRWTRKIDIFAMDKIFVPVNIRNEKRIQYFDSMAGAGSQCLEVLLKYLHDESQHKKNTPFDATGWELVGTTDDTPQQDNSFDCGVFTCMFADYLSLDRPLTFSQRDMKFYRRRMVLRMVHGSIPQVEPFDV